MNELLYCVACKSHQIEVLAGGADPGDVGLYRLRCSNDPVHLNITGSVPVDVLRSHPRRVGQWLQQRIFDAARTELPDDAVSVLGLMLQKNERIEELEARLKRLAGPVLDLVVEQAKECHERHEHAVHINSWWQCWKGQCAKARTAVIEFRETYDAARDGDEAIRPSHSG